MYENRVERLVSSSASGTPSVGLSEASTRSEPRRLNGIFFVATVLVTQLSWLGALAYAAFWVL
jgi:hypothetical protein